MLPNHTKCILLCALLFILTMAPAFSQHAGEGRFVSDKFAAPSLSGNTGGEDPVRRLSIYLPPGYDAGKQRYPVIYFLHGFGVNDSLMVVWLQLKEVMDRGIKENRIPPAILVLPDNESRYFGAFYTNSEVNGNWGDFISHDVVNFVDTHYRTLSRKENRGLCGHSMGGNGVMRIVMQYPNIFNAAYALSPGALHWNREFNLDNPAFKRLSELTDEKDILRLDEDPTVDPLQFWIPLMASLGRSFSPDVNSKPHLGRLPVSYAGKKRVIHPDVLSSWEEKFPINMAHRHVDALKSLRGLKIDWGRNDEFPHIPATCRELSLRLEALGVPHEAEEYIGGHENKLGGTSGRIFTEVLPFFATLLEFK